MKYEWSFKSCVFLMCKISLECVLDLMLHGVTYNNSVNCQVGPCKSLYQNINASSACTESNLTSASESQESLGSLSSPLWNACRNLQGPTVLFLFSEHPYSGIPTQHPCYCFPYPRFAWNPWEGSLGFLAGSWDSTSFKQARSPFRNPASRAPINISVWIPMNPKASANYPGFNTS